MELIKSFIPRYKTKKDISSKMDETLKDKALQALYNEIRTTTKNNASGPKLLEALQSLYKKFVGVQKGLIHLTDALIFAKLFAPLFKNILDNDETVCTTFEERLMTLAVNVQEIIWKQFEYEKLKKVVSKEKLLFIYSA